MDRVFSTRLSEAIVSRIADLARQLRTSKKTVVERAVALLAAQVESEGNEDVLDRTHGAWKRSESASDLVREARTTFNDAMARNRR